MRFSSVLVGIVLAAALLAGLFEFASSLTNPNAYNVQLSETEINVTPITSQVSSSVSDIQDKWTVDKTSFLALVPDAIILVKNVLLLPFTTVNTLITFFVSALSLPVWVSEFVINAFWILAIFGFIAIITRYKYT